MVRRRRPHPAAQFCAGDSLIQLQAKRNALEVLCHKSRAQLMNNEGMDIMEAFERRYQSNKNQKTSPHARDRLRNSIDHITKILQKENIPVPEDLLGPQPQTKQLSDLPTEIVEQTVGEVVRDTWPSYPILHGKYGVGYNGSGVKRVLDKILQPFKPDASAQKTSTHESFGAKLYSTAIEKFAATMQGKILFPGFILRYASPEVIVADWARFASTFFLKNVRFLNAPLDLGVYISGKAILNRSKNAVVTQASVRFISDIKVLMPKLKTAHFPLTMRTKDRMLGPPAFTRESMRATQTEEEPSEMGEFACWRVKKDVMLLVEAAKQANLDQLTMDLKVGNEDVDEQEGVEETVDGKSIGAEEVVGMMLGDEEGKRKIVRL